MKLSDAIRLGAMLKPQAFGAESAEVPTQGFTTQLFGTHERVEIKAIGTCAFGAAFDAAGCQFRPSTPEESANGGLRGHSSMETVITPDRWIPVMWGLAACPICEHTNHVYRLIPHLNDDHRWTRERIADWVATIEAAAEPTDTTPREDVPAGVPA